MIIIKIVYFKQKLFVFSLIFLGILSFSYLYLFSSQSKKPKNMILFIGDGMGTKHLEAASWYKTGKKDGLFIQNLGFRGLVNSVGPDNKIPDSANSMSSFATGMPLSYGVLGLDGTKRLETVAEKLKKKGKAIGLVTNASITDATPASFFAHQKDRSYYDDIYDELFVLKPKVILGGPAYYSKKTLRSLDQARKAGYTIVKTKKELKKVDLDKPLYGEFHWDTYTKYNQDGVYVNMPWLLNYPPNHYKNIQKMSLANLMFPNTLSTKNMPSLADMAKKAFAILKQHKKGYLLVIESALIDKAAHMGFKNNMVAETLAFDALVEAITKEVAEDTLILITADHETGGLKLSEPFKKGVLPTMQFTQKPPVIKSQIIKNNVMKQTSFFYKKQNKMLTKDQESILRTFQFYAHTKNKISVFAKGPGAEKIRKMSHISELSQLF